MNRYKVVLSNGNEYVIRSYMEDVVIFMNMIADKKYVVFDHEVNNSSYVISIAINVSDISVVLPLPDKDKI